MGLIIGIDEVGRGCWAGPLLVVAAMLKQSMELPAGLADSKKLSKIQREAIFPILVDKFHFGEGWVQSEEIDQFGLTKAMKIAVSRALISLGASHDTKIIIDGHINYCPEEFTKAKAVVKADSSHAVVSAASIYAKVKRDQHMIRLAKFHPFYGFEKHVGYGTALHQAALRIHGVSKLHRKSYKPVKAFLA